MTESELNKAERPRQQWFRIKHLAGAFLLVLLLGLERATEDPRPNRTLRPGAAAHIAALALPLPQGGEGLRIGGLWQLSSSEQRLGGLSALAVDGRELVAVTDSGAVVRWPAPGGRAGFRDLPGGPGLPQWKRNRDAEALARDPGGRGWWVAFEQFHSLFLFSPDFSRTLERRPVRVRTPWRNWGIEGIAEAGGGGLLLFPENGGELIWLRGGNASRFPLEVSGQVSDAARLPDGRILLSLREVRPWGIRNRIGLLVRSGDRFGVRLLGTLELGRWDNVEGLAAEALGGGGIRLWFVTDNDDRRRTLLGRVDVPAVRPGD